MSQTGHAAIDSDVKAYIDERIDALRRELPEDRVTLVVFSGDLDRQLASLVIATGAAAMGMEVTIFYTFWGLSALKRGGPSAGAKSLKERMFAAMTPVGVGSMPVSKLNFGGVGRALLKSMMKDKDVTSVEEMFAMAREMGVQMVACTMSMDVMGIAKEELIDGVQLGGVATFLGSGARSRVSLFI